MERVQRRISTTSLVNSLLERRLSYRQMILNFHPSSFTRRRCGCRATLAELTKSIHHMGCIAGHSDAQSAIGSQDRNGRISSDGDGFRGVPFGECARQMAAAYRHFLEPPLRFDWISLLNGNWRFVMTRESRSSVLRSNAVEAAMPELPVLMPERFSRCHS